jgi:hypothetical protein
VTCSVLGKHLDVTLDKIQAKEPRNRGPRARGSATSLICAIEGDVTLPNRKKKDLLMLWSCISQLVCIKGEIDEALVRAYEG